MEKKCKKCDSTNIYKNGVCYDHFREYANAVSKKHYKKTSEYRKTEAYKDKKKKWAKAYYDKNKEKLIEKSRVNYNSNKVKNICENCGKEFYKGRSVKFCSRKCFSDKQKERRLGEGNPAYRNGFYSGEPKDRKINKGGYSKHKTACKNYKKKLIEKNGYLSCENCGCNINGTPRFEVHHIVYLSEAPNHEEIDNPLNLINLCISCHNKFHSKKRITRKKVCVERGLEELFGRKLYDR